MDSIMLYSIALQSPYEGGEAVYRARVMLGIDEEEYGTPSSARLVNADGETIVNAAFYPNPAADRVTVLYELKDGETGTYEITGINGQLVQSGNLKAGQPQINISGIDPGVYMLKLTVDGKIVTSDKLVIIRQ